MDRFEAEVTFREPRPYASVPSPRRSQNNLPAVPEPTTEPTSTPVSRLGRVAASNAEALAGWGIDALMTSVVTAGGVCLTKSGAAVLAFDPTLSRIDWSITVFWICFFLAPLLFYVKFRAGTSAAESVEDRISEVRAEILGSTDELLSTAAISQGLLHETYTQALARPYASFPAADAVQLLTVDIRIALSTITALVQEVEPPRPGAQIAANLMCFTKLDTRQPLLPPRVQGALQLERGKRLEDQSGVLFLDPDLSSCTEVEAGERDPNLHDLAFYIPARKVDQQGTGVLQMLPGAPYAFVAREMIATNPEQLIKLCRDGSHAVSPEAGDALERYFRSNAGRGIRSIVCHPLMYVEGKLPRAVLNIHSNYDGMLESAERRQQLYYLLRPWTLALLHLLEMRAHYQGLVGGGPVVPAVLSQPSARRPLSPAVMAAAPATSNGNGRKKRRRNR